jgi:uncharacterized protein YecA (UPF0149 family)
MRFQEGNMVKLFKNIDDNSTTKNTHQEFNKRIDEMMEERRRQDKELLEKYPNQGESVTKQF